MTTVRVAKAAAGGAAKVPKAVRVPKAARAKAARVTKAAKAREDAATAAEVGFPVAMLLTLVAATCRSVRILGRISSDE